MKKRSRPLCARGFAALIAVIFAVLVVLCILASNKASHPAVHAVGAPLSLYKNLGFEYHPSRLETTWLTHVSKWSVNGEEFCRQVSLHKQPISYWMEATTHQLRHKGPPMDPEPLDKAVFSSFQKKFSCGGKAQVLTTYIEPLATSLRHPLAPCNMRKLLSRDYLLLTSSVELHSMSCGLLKVHTFMFDLGASTWSAGSGGISQQWFVDAYQRRGIKFDRMLMWEAQGRNGSHIFKDVPKEVFASYQYFNVPAVADRSDPSNPLNILKKITTPQDFVVLKLDIDNGPIERQFVEQLLGDEEVLQRVDEFFFEHHVNFKLMVKRGWGQSGVYNRNETLYDSYKLFSLLRSKGIRAHGWP